ncbi:putative uncharacterized protein DDB_G0294196 [Cimex lectularius]|uniref:CPR type cuticle protein n=1 Tax=Cimex lectularius TaxID=79782 RepID=A0A8I6RNX9_CIMLE|nr:putative uncharacterized protein DDB_G0294196 [Cimex lectularius]
MKPYIFLLTIASLGYQVLCQETGRSLFGFPSLFSNGPSQPEVTYRELTDLPNNQKGFVITNSQYTPPSRTSPQLTEEQRLFVKAQDDFRKSIAKANQQRFNGEVHPAEMVFQQLPREEAFGQKVFSTQNQPQQNFGLNVPTRNSEPFRPSQPINEPAHFLPPPPPPFMQLDTPKNEPAQFFQNVPSQTFNHQPTPSQRVETFLPPQTEHTQIFQRIQPSAQQVSPSFVQTPESQSFGQLRPTQQTFVQNQQVDTFKTADEQPRRRRPQRIRQNFESPVDHAVRDNPPAPVLTSQDELFKKQAESAKYSFQSSVADGINDNSQVRQETRDGLKLTGLYSYSDGYFKRTVHYVADENGYRVVKEESEPIGTGPVHNPSGQVDVLTSHSGTTLQYSLQGDRLPKYRTSTVADNRKH